MQRLPHPDDDTEKLIQWMEQSDQWVTSQGDARVKAICSVCKTREYFDLMGPQQMPAIERKKEIATRECCGGERIA